MTEFNLEAFVRKNMAGGYRKSLLGRGLVPAVVYGKTIGNLPLEVSRIELQKAVRGGKNTIINLAVSGNGGPYKVMVREMQHDPIKRLIVHVDFQQISMEDSINTTVDIHIVGEADGGLVRPVLRSLEIACLPTGIPDKVTVDVTGMRPGDSLAVRDLKVPGGVKVLSDPDTAVVAIMAPDAGPAEEKTVENVTGENGNKS
ncbi:MAG: 50S ribosomal protein L25 [Desulfocucumaceae bacterium]